MSIEQAWQKFNKQLLYYIQSRVNSIDDAQDIHASIFLVLIQKKEELRNIENLNAWLYRIAKNKIIDYYRSHQKHDELIEDLTKDTESDMLDDITKEQFKQCMNTVIQSFPANYKDVLVATQLNEIPDKEYAEIAKISLKPNR